MTVTRKETQEREAGISPRGFAARSRVLSVFASPDRNQMTFVWCLVSVSLRKNESVTTALVWPMDFYRLPLL